jgi:hypothetical protein
MEIARLLFAIFMDSLILFQILIRGMIEEIK